MALGFTVTNITDKKIRADRNMAKTSTPRVRVQQFGDGYEQRAVEGINNINESYTVMFQNRERAEADDIIAFFDTQAGVTAFGFTIPDTNSTTTTTATVNGAVSSSTSVTISAANLNISQGATVSGSGVSGSPTVSLISGTSLTLSSAQSISDTTTLTFTNANEREIKVICNDWNIAYISGDFYTVTANFRRVYEP